MKYILKAMKLGNRAGQINHKYGIWSCRSWPEIKILGIFGIKIAMRSIFMKFGTQNKSNMLIINILIGADDFDPNLGTKTEMCSNFYEIWR